MATRGRKPTPTAIKVLEGNPGKRPLNDREPKPAKKAPSCPKWLETDAKREWRRLSHKLEQLGILTEADMSVFASYCQAYAHQKIMNRCAEQLGLTPSSRSRLIAGEPGGTVKDDMEELLGGG